MYRRGQLTETILGIIVVPLVTVVATALIMRNVDKENNKDKLKKLEKKNLQNRGFFFF